MAKWCNDTILDTALAYIKTNAVKAHVCSAMPTTYTEANATYMLANSEAIDLSGITLLNGDTSGRKLAVPEIAAVTITNSGDAKFVALTNGSDTLLYVTDCTQQTLTAANLVTIPAWDIELRDPS